MSRAISNPAGTGAASGARGAVGQRLAKLNKRWLLAGTAIATGTVAGIFAMPQAALAGCNVLTPGVTWACADTETADQSWTPTAASDANGWDAHLLGDASHEADVQAQIVIENNGDHDGTFLMDAGTTLDPTGKHALIINNNTPNDSIVNVIIHGDITADGGYDAVRIIDGATVNMTVGDGHLTGGPANPGNGNAITVHDIQNLFDLTIDQGGIVESHNIAVFVAGPNGQFNTQAVGAVTIHTDGHITSDTTAVRIEAESAIDITNQDDGSIVANGTGNGIYANGDDIVTVTNTGHVEGSNSQGILIVAGTVATINNHSYLSVMGTTGEEIDNVDQAIVNNESGLDAGLTVDGVKIDNINSNDHGGKSNDAVYVDNKEGGVIIGYNDGVEITNVHGTYGSTATEVEIDNSASSPGGLIFGVNGNGVDVEHTQGDVIVHNEGTNVLPGAIDFSLLDPAVYGTAGTFKTALDNLTTSTGGVNTGIFGSDDAVHMKYIGGVVDIGNANGFIGSGNDDAINLYNIGGNVTPVGGDVVTIDNTDGVVYGRDEAVHIYKVLNGGVSLWNEGGFLKGLDDDAVHIGNVEGNVAVWNGADKDGNGGSIFSLDRAIDIFDVQTAQVWNGNGVTIGEGSYDQPVVQLDTSRKATLGDLADGYGAGNFSAMVVNDGGLMSPDSLPNLDRSGEHSSVVGIDGGAIMSDVQNITQFVMSGGASGDPTSLPGYADAASGLLMKTNGGATYVENDMNSLMVGRLDMDGRTYYDVPDGDPIQGNEIVNYGTWFMVNAGKHDQYGNEIHGSPYDTFINLGLIQGAFDPDKKEKLSFDLNDFYNGTDPLADLDPTGILSVMDGAPGDEIKIKGNFYGAQNAQDNSLVGIDVRFGPAWDKDVDWQDQIDTVGKSDELKIDGYAEGTTGFIIDPTNLVAGGFNDKGIKVAEVEDFGNVNGCIDVACQYGDLFYISSWSNHYVEFNGIGAIQDDLSTWYLTGKDHGKDYDYVLVSTDAPAGDQLATVMGQAQGAWYQTDEVVADHLRGNEFPSGGTSGADMGTTTPAKSTNMGLWVKGTGAWTNTNTTVDDSVVGPIDTSYNQDTYGLLGGADMRPGSGDGPVRFGLFGGYVNSNANFDQWMTTSKFEGGTVGGYMDVTNGNGMYGDAEVKADFLNLSYTGPAGLAIASADTTSVGVRANVGYRVQGARGFFEPVISGTYVNTTIGGMTTGGGSGISFSNGESARAGAGARFGAAFSGAKGGMTELSFLARAWYEFEPANTVTITDPSGVSDSYTDPIQGLFGEASATLSVYNAARSGSGFLSAGVEGNDDFLTVDAKGGIRTNF